MGLTTKNILGVNVTTAPKLQILEEIRKYLTQFSIFNFQFSIKRAKPFIIFTPNPEIIVYAQKDTNFKRIVNSAQINIPDGWGVVWALKKLSGVTIEKLSGVDLMLNLCQLAAGKGFRVGLIGGREGVALRSLECLQRQFPNLKGWVMDGPEISNIKNSRRSGIHDAVTPIKSETASGQKSKIHIKDQKEILKTPGRWPDFVGRSPDSVGRRPKDSFQVEGSVDSYFNDLADEIIERKTNILFVALGCPKQEYFISAISHQSSVISHDKPLVLMAVGGAFDYLAGKIPRAPAWMRERGLEWLYRLITQPWRLSRQIRGAEFFYRVATHHFSPA